MKFLEGSTVSIKVMDNTILAPSEYECICIMDEAVYKCHNHKMTCQAFRLEALVSPRVIKTEIFHLLYVVLSVQGICEPIV